MAATIAQIRCLPHSDWLPRPSSIAGTVQGSALRYLDSDIRAGSELQGCATDTEWLGVGSRFATEIIHARLKPAFPSM